MGVVLVLEPERLSAEALLAVLRGRVRIDPILVTSTAAAIEAIGRTMPDLILVSALLSPRDEDRLMAHLRSLEGAAHLQTLTIPRLSLGAEEDEEAGQRSVFGRFRKKKRAAPARAGCDPEVFAEEISAHLARAADIRNRPAVAPAPYAEPVFRPAIVEPDPAPVPMFEAAPTEIVEEAATEEAAIELDDSLERIARRFGFDPEMLKVADADAPPALQRHSTERLAAQVAAVQAEAKATLASELERVRADGEERRLTELARLKGEADIVLEAAITEARAAAEHEARDALLAELTRVRSEAEGVFAADLARVRAEVEEKLSAQVGAAETRLAVAEQARSAAEAAAAMALEAEVRRVHGEAEARLQSELDRIRQDAEAARIAEQFHARHATEQIREAAVREAREIAEEAARRTLEAEIARVRTQADTFLETEVARVRAEGQDRQAAELQALREQMAEIRETAARTAAEQSGDYYKIWQPKPAPAEETEALAPLSEEHEEIDRVLAGRGRGWLKWALPTAACLLFIANNGMVIDTFASFRRPAAAKAAPAASVAEPLDAPVIVEPSGGELNVKSTPVGAQLLIDGRSYGETPLRILDLQSGVHTLVLRTPAGTITRRITIRAGQTTVVSEAFFSGWLAIFSPIPLDVTLNGTLTSIDEDGRIMTAPGSYEVVLVNKRFNYHGSETLEVRPGEVTAHTVSVPEGAVHVVAPEGSEISVDGESAGQAPIADLSLPLGTHEIKATHSELGERTTSIAVRFGEVTEATLDFER